MRLLRWLAALAFLPWLVALAFARPYADDFCTIAATKGDSWAFMLYQYGNWSGRYTSMFTSSLSLQVGAWFTPVVTAGLFTAWWLALRRLTGSLLATLILLVMLIVAPDPFQSYYWLTGALTYLAPMVLATWCVVVANRPALSALLAFISAGFSDIAGALQLFAFVGLTAGWNRHMAFPALTTIIGLALVALAPGNAIRRAYFPPPQLGASLAASVFGLDDVFRSAWPALLLIPVIYWRASREGPISANRSLDCNWWIPGPIRRVLFHVRAAPRPGLGSDPVFCDRRSLPGELSRWACIVAIMILALGRGTQVAEGMAKYAADYDAGRLLSLPQESWVKACTIEAGYIP